MVRKLGTQIASNCIDCHMPVQPSNLLVLDADDTRFKSKGAQSLDSCLPEDFASMIVEGPACAAGPISFGFRAQDLRHCQTAHPVLGLSRNMSVAVARDRGSLLRKNSSRILHKTKTDCARTIHAGRHHQQFAVLDEFVGLREIPDRPLRLVVTATA